MQHLFVVTYGRSGSTVLLNLLNAIDGYCIKGENGGVINSLAKTAQIIRYAQSQRPNKGLTVETPWYGISEIDADQFARNLAETFTKDILIPPSGTRVTGFKEIRYMPYHLDDKAFDQTMDFMASSFPDARILFNTRDGSEVCKSGMWTDKQRFNARDVKRWVVESDKRFHRWNEKLGDRAFLIDYAQFNRKPEGFYPLIEWLGEDLSPERVKEISTQRLKHVRNHGDKPSGMKAKLRGLLKA